MILQLVMRLCAVTHKLVIPKEEYPCYAFGIFTILANCFS